MKRKDRSAQPGPTDNRPAEPGQCNGDSAALGGSEPTAAVVHPVPNRSVSPQGRLARFLNLMARAPGAGAFTCAHAWLLRKMHIRPRWFGSEVIQLEVLGRNTGQLRRRVVVAVAVEEGWIVASANGGLNRRPSWTYNLEQSTTAVVFDRGVRCEIEAELLIGESAAPFWTQYSAEVPIVSQYQAMTSREFDLFLLRRV